MGIASSPTSSVRPPVGPTSGNLQTDELGNILFGFNRDNFNGDPGQIPLEDYDTYLEAAQLYVKTIETDPNFKPDDNKLTIIAQSIIDQKPSVLAA